MAYSESTTSAPAPPTKRPSTKRLRVAQGILLLFHVTGFVGLAFSQDPDFYLQFVPLNLLLTAALLLAHDRHSPAPMFGWFCLSIMVMGFGIEVAGVRTGVIFGSYTYGNVLGIRVFDTPLIIGLNWLLMTYLAGGLAQRLPLPGLVRAILAAVLMVGMDVCIEPVAVHYGWWKWAFDVIPLQNFKAWLAVSFIFQLYYNSSHVAAGRNPLVPFVYLVQLLFFFGLGLLIR
ncbi:carotenoid biosynthesis protein [Hymenobacter koreensis]|uniref:Carotenoid biosynthesis protein n=1 Tax=Hymenobacter koreensis TaxID=1084523 RepID=A0ABP8JIG2_9BACT